MRCKELVRLLQVIIEIHFEVGLLPQVLALRDDVNHRRHGRQGTGLTARENF